MNDDKKRNFRETFESTKIANGTMAGSNAILALVSGLNAATSFISGGTNTGYVLSGTAAVFLATAVVHAKNMISASRAKSQLDGEMTELEVYQAVKDQHQTIIAGSAATILTSVTAAGTLALSDNFLSAAVFGVGGTVLPAVQALTSRKGVQVADKHIEISTPAPAAE